MSRSRARRSPDSCSTTRGPASSGCRSASSSASRGWTPACTSSPIRAGPGRRSPARLLGARGGHPRGGRPPITYEWYRGFIQFLIDNGAESGSRWVITLRRDRRRHRPDRRRADRHRRVLRRADEHVVPAGRLGIDQPRAVHPGRRHSCWPGRSPATTASTATCCRASERRGTQRLSPARRPRRLLARPPDSDPTADSIDLPTPRVRETRGSWNPQPTPPTPPTPRSGARPEPTSGEPRAAGARALGSARRRARPRPRWPGRTRSAGP